MATKPPERTVHVQRPHTTRDDWNPSKIKSARRSAEMGNLLPAADLADHLLADDRASGVLAQRVRGLLKSDVRIEDDRSDEQTPITKALKEDLWDAYPENDLAQLIEWAHLLGVGLGEHRWDLNEHDRLVPRLHVWHPRWLRFDHTTRTWRLQTMAGEITLDLESGEWILLTPYGSHAPWRHGLYRTLAPYWLLKRYAISDWGGYSEAHGNPLRVGLTEQDAGKAYREELAQDLQNIAGTTGMGLPPGVKVELLEATARTWETFQAQIQTANTAMSIAIAGQNLTSEVQSGSRAAATVHDNIRHDLIESDEQALSTALHHQMIRPWAAYNFGDTPAPWARWETDPPADAPQIEQHHISAGAVSVNDIRRSLGLEPWEGDENDQPVRPEPTPGLLSAHTDRARPVRLASGDDPATAPGMIQGQAYLDRLATRGAPLEPIHDRMRALLDALDDATSYDELLDRLPSLVADIDDAGPMIEALIMASAAGVVAETEDEGDEAA